MSAALPRRELGGRSGADLVHARFGACPMAVRAQIENVSSSIAEAGLGEALRADMTIILGEVLNNIVEHALRDDPGATIGLDVTRACGRILVETTDRGRPLPPRLLGATNLPDVTGDVPDLPEGGFGWFIIHSLAQDMTYERADGTNHLSFFLIEA